MSDEKQQDLERQLEAGKERLKQLEDECSQLRDRAAALQNQLETYQPLAQQWLREHGPSREECEKILLEMLEHPEELLDLGNSSEDRVLRDDIQERHEHDSVLDVELDPVGHRYTD